VGLDTHSAVFQCMHAHSWHVDVEPPPTILQAHAAAAPATAGTRAWGAPLLFEVVQSPRRTGRAGAADGASAEERVPRWPAVMHFNSFDGKEMMARVVEALKGTA
jgi:hypothetical protein